MARRPKLTPEQQAALAADYAALPKKGPSGHLADGLLKPLLTRHGATKMMLYRILRKRHVPGLPG